MTIVEQKGDLFLVDEKYALAHCISHDCAMGAGIATAFREKFPGMKSSLIRTLKTKQINWPNTVIYRSRTKERIVFNLITKNKCWQKPTYKSIETCIWQMANMC
ncbi:MAG TPA: hypothetical protein GX005_00500, partial [Bacteroidales bacterium]|nr:hypothetical protein [Bacteroidales bacterium]